CEGARRRRGDYGARGGVAHGEYCHGYRQSVPASARKFFALHRWREYSGLVRRQSGGKGFRNLRRKDGSLRRKIASQACRGVGENGVWENRKEKELTIFSRQMRIEGLTRQHHFRSGTKSLE